MTGKVVRILDDKGYGFIKADSRDEYFFHRDDFQGDWSDLEVGTLLDFEPEKTPKGLRARDVAFAGE